MKLYKKLAHGARERFDNYFGDFEEDMQDIHYLDDFLADEGFELEFSSADEIPYWVYYFKGDQYSSDLEFVNVYSDWLACKDGKRWGIGYYKRGFFRSDAYFDTVYEVIDYLKN